MAQPDYPQFVLVTLADEHSWEVWRGGEDHRDPARDLFGTVAISEVGYHARSPSGAVYGPFPTLDEAAYPLALEVEGDPRTAGLLLGSPAALGPFELGAPDRRVAPTAPDGVESVAPPPMPAARRRPNPRRRILLLPVVVVAAVALLLAVPTPRLRRPRRR